MSSNNARHAKSLGYALDFRLSVLSNEHQFPRAYANPLIAVAQHLGSVQSCVTQMKNVPSCMLSWEENLPGWAWLSEVKTCVSNTEAHILSFWAQLVQSLLVCIHIAGIEFGYTSDVSAIVSGCSLHHTRVMWYASSYTDRDMLAIEYGLQSVSFHDLSLLCHPWLHKVTSTNLSSLAWLWR